MKFMHLSDLHLGKRVNEFSMIEDQQYILNQIAEIADREKPDGVLIAGDVYDKSVPPIEAVQLFDDFSRASGRTEPAGVHHQRQSRQRGAGRLWQQIDDAQWNLSLASLRWISKTCDLGGRLWQNRCLSAAFSEAGSCASIFSLKRKLTAIRRP